MKSLIFAIVVTLGTTAFAGEWYRTYKPIYQPYKSGKWYRPYDSSKWFPPYKADLYRPYKSPYKKYTSPYRPYKSPYKKYTSPY